MNRLIQALLLTLSLALGAGSAMAAKDDAKPAGADKAAASAASGDKATSKTGTADKAKAGAQIDLNSATEEELKTLPQIGDARASAIVKNRPYARKDELVSKKVLTQKQYDGIKDKVIAKQGTGAGASASSGASSAAKGAGASSGASGMNGAAKSSSADKAGSSAAASKAPAGAGEKATKKSEPAATK